MTESTTPAHTPAPGGHPVLPTGTWKIPLIGPTKKVYVIGAALALAVTVILILRKRSAATAGALATDSAGNVGVINPATGFVAGSPEDLAAINGAIPSNTSGSDSGGGGGSTSDQVEAGPPFTNNAAWDQYATAYLVGLGEDPSTVGRVLGAYLSGSQVTPADKHLIDTATGAAGQPPTAGPNGYPPSVNVVGDVTGGGTAPGALTLKRGATTTSSAKFSWSKVPGADWYAYTATGPDYAKSGRVQAAALNVAGLRAGQTYTVNVHALSGTKAGPTASATFTTPATAGGGTTGGTAAYTGVPVGHYDKSHPAWDSTISGIASHYGYSDWETVWNDAKNAPLRAKRHTPDAIQPGDIVYVKEK